MKKMFATMLFLFCSCAYGQNVVTDWAAIVQPAVNNPPEAAGNPDRTPGHYSSRHV